MRLLLLKLSVFRNVSSLESRQYSNELTGIVAANIKPEITKCYADRFYALVKIHFI